MFRARRDYTEICEREERFTCDRSFLFWRYLLDYLKREKINILFLDIELPGKDGVMVGKYIREVLEEENIFLIYISSKENYALQLFQNRPFDFLVKPIEAAKIYHVLDNIYRISGKNSVGFEFQTQNSTYRISY